MITGNEPAMPVEMDYDVTGAKSHRISDCTWKETGLTIRQQFAAMAMQGLCANSIPGQHNAPERLVFEAVQVADALIAELNKPQLK